MDARVDTEITVKLELSPDEFMAVHKMYMNSLHQYPADAIECGVSLSDVGGQLDNVKATIQSVRRRG